MVHPRETNELKLALPVIGEDDNGEDEIWVRTGIARWHCESLQFDRGSDNPEFAFPDEWLERLRKVPDKTKEVFFGCRVLHSSDNRADARRGGCERIHFHWFTGTAIGRLAAPPSLIAP